MEFQIYTKPYKAFGDDAPKTECFRCGKLIDLTKPPIVTFDAGNMAFYFHIDCAKEICREYLNKIELAVDEARDSVNPAEMCPFSEDCAIKNVGDCRGLKSEMAICPIHNTEKEIEEINKELEGEEDGK